MNPLVANRVLRRPASRFLSRAALLAVVMVQAVSAPAGERRFFRPAQSTIPYPSLSPARPVQQPRVPQSQVPQASPSEPTFAEPPKSSSPLTDAPRFVPPSVPMLKTPSLPIEPSAPPVLPPAAPTPLFTAPQIPALQAPSPEFTAPQFTVPPSSPAAPAVSPQTVTSFRPDGAACLLVDVTASYLNRLVSSPRQDAGPVNDVILGARVEGAQTTQSTVSIRTLPCPQLARFDVNLGGESCSRTTAMTPQAAIDSAARQRFELHKSVEFDGTKFVTRSPATHLETCQRNLRARTGASQIPVVNSIAETIALNQANLRQPLARQEAARQVTNRLTPTFNQAIDERLGAANQWLAGLSSSSPDLHAFITSARWSSTDAAVHGELPAAVPVEGAVPPGRGGANVRMHESFAPSIAAALQLHGRQVSVDEIERWIGVFSSDVSGNSTGSALPSLTGPASASLRLADDSPLAFQFQNDELRVVLRASIKVGNELELPIHRITVGFGIRREGDSIQLEPLPVEVQSEAAETIAADAVETVIRSQIESRLRPLTISADAIPPMENGVRTRVSEVTAANGWLMASFD